MQRRMRGVGRIGRAVAGLGMVLAVFIGQGSGAGSGVGAYPAEQPAAQATAQPTAPAIPAVQGANARVSGGYTLEGGGQIQTRVLNLPVAQGTQVFVSAPVEAPLPFTDVAPYWDHPAPDSDNILPPDAVRVELRTSPDGQTWTDWQATDLEDISDPREPVTRTYASLVGVPQDVRTHRWAQARITLTATLGRPAPQISDLSFTFIDSGVTPQVPVATVSGGTAPVKPPVISRVAWGSPDGEGSPQWTPQYRRVTHFIIHHTETTNTDGDYAARVRSIWYFHTFTRGWGDIGYNYLVDPRGNIYEGRAGGDDVAAGHAYPFNYGSMGISLIGNYDQVAPSAAMRDALIRLLAWASDRRGIDPQGTGSFTGALDCGGSVTLTRPNIAGHRDFRGVGCGQEFNAKTCPGTYAYALLPAIRAALAGGVVPNPPYRAIFESQVTPPTIAPGAVVTATLIVRNGGSFVWPRGGTNPVRLGYRWYFLDGRQVPSPADLRTSIPTDMGYGARATIVAQVRAPATPGTYELRWDMVHELKTWFEDAGSTPVRLRVAVTGGDTAPPSAHMVALPPYQDTLQFAVQWNGGDEAGGSGLASYDVQVRTGADGGWTDLLAGTVLTTTTVTGQEGQTYGFRVRARDRAGNVGSYPANPETVTTVSTRPPSLAVISPVTGSRVLPGTLVVTGTTDPGVLVRVNDTAAAVAADGSFAATVAAQTSPLLLLVSAQTPSGKVSRQTVLVGVGGRYPDVPVDSPAFAAVEYLSDAGVVRGDSSGLFRPGATMTRGEYVIWLAAALRWPVQVPTAARFLDVPPEHPAAGAIEAAVSRGAIGGYGSRQFRPDQPIARDEAIKTTALAAGWPLLPAPDSPFSDAPLTHWAAPYIVTAYRHGLLLDSPADTLRPAAPLTRGEAARFLYYLLGDLGVR